MCGIGGFFRSESGATEGQTQAWLEAMGESIRHRGPDGSGVWMDDRIGLVHRRLAIIDLSDAGAQPMLSESGRYILVFNGEIYNFPDLRRELENEGVQFRSRTDSEVLLNLYEREGEAALQKLNGMFALAIWDTLEQSLFLARDRLGKKPLYLYRSGNRLAFASELKAILQLPYVERKIRPDAIKDYFFYQYVPDPKTIFENIEKVPPAHWMRIGREGRTQAGCYWELNFTEPNSRSPESLQEELLELLEDSVRIRMLSDVPLGAFLSGGIDSSAVVGLMARNSAQPVTTCSIGFDNDQFDEVEHARRVAEQFGTDHHEFTVKDNIARSMPHIASYFDEPFADPSFVPTYFVSKLARQKVTVALAGDGGDESFAGYEKYRTDQIENRLRGCLPKTVRETLFPFMATMLGPVGGSVARRARHLLGTLATEPAHGFFRTNAFMNETIWNAIVSESFRNELKGYEVSEITESTFRAAPADDHLSRILYTDIKTFLLGDILTKVDRMSMANSLEVRAPLLDYRIVELAANIPSALKLKGGEKKYLLKEAFKGLLDDETLYRKKMGFSVPLDAWMTEQLGQDYESFVSSGDSLVGQILNRRTFGNKNQNGKNVGNYTKWLLLCMKYSQLNNAKNGI